MQCEHRIVGNAIALVLEIGNLLAKRLAAVRMFQDLHQQG